jgi:hypothetical protein
MKSLVAFMKSPVGKLHTAFSMFILFNLLSGLVDLFIHYTPWLVSVHFYTGLMIVVAPVAYLLFAKNRGIILKAFSKMALPQKAELQKGKRSVLFFKLITIVIFLLIAANALGGVFMKFGLLTIVSYNIHVFNFKVLLALVPLHGVMAYLMRSARTKKPAGARKINNTRNV